MISPRQARQQKPLSRRDEHFLEQVAATAGTDDDPKLIWRAQRAWPWLPTGRIAEAAHRIWVVPSVTTAGRRYHVCLDGGDCYSLDASGVKHPCPHKQFGGVMRCAHHQAAERAELNMFGGGAAEYFAPKGVDYEPPQRAGKAVA